jgi:hypothetical protein
MTHLSTAVSFCNYKKRRIPVPSVEEVIYFGKLLKRLLAPKLSEYGCTVIIGYISIPDDYTRCI